MGVLTYNTYHNFKTLIKMKNLLILLTLTLALSCYNKDDDNPQNPIDQLPPETQIVQILWAIW